MDKLDRELAFGEGTQGMALGGVAKDGKAFSTEHMIAKINELVEAINKLNEELSPIKEYVNSIRDKIYGG